MTTPAVATEQQPASGNPSAEGAKPEGAATVAATATDTSLLGAEGVKPEGEAKPEGEGAKKTETEGAPETYEFVAPEGVELDKDLLGEFHPVAKELNLKQADAQKLVDIAAKIITKQFDALAATHEAWAESSRTDKDIGGDNLQPSLTLGKKVLDAFGSPELRTVLNETKLGNHPALIKAFAKIGKAMSEDVLVIGEGTTPSADPLHALYPTMKR
jgi:hypothetical protein